jgi:hypothetical protein
VLLLKKKKKLRSTSENTYTARPACKRVKGKLEQMELRIQKEKKRTRASDGRVKYEVKETNQRMNKRIAYCCKTN